MADKPLIIQDWNKGQAESSLVGFQTMKGVEVFDTPGIVKIANRSLSLITTPPTALPVFFIKDTAGNYYYGLATGKIYKNNGVLIYDVAETVWDGIIYKDYLIISHGTSISVYGLLSGSPTFYLKWRTLAKSVYGDSTSRFDITNISGTTYRYTWDGTGIDPAITAVKFAIGQYLSVFSTNMTAGNRGTFIITGSGTNYVEVTNALGVVEADKTLGTGGYFGVGTTTGTYIKLLAGQDDVIYIANGGNVASLTSFTASAPATAPTATLTNVALDLPESIFIVTMCELGKFLMLGTTFGSTWITRNNFKTSNIYTWDRVSTSFNLPIRLNENSIQQLFSDNNKLYVVAGLKGNIYITDSTNYVPIKKLPINADRPPATFYQFYPNAIAMNANGNLLIGTSTYSDGYVGGVGESRHGVYEINTKDPSYPCVLKNIADNGASGSVLPFFTGVIYSGNDDTTTFGFQSGTTYGLDTTDSNAYVDIATIESPNYQVGTRLNRKIYQNLEFTLARPFVTGQSITISYRRNLDASYTDIGTFSYATLGAVISHNTKALIDEAENLQIKITLTQPITVTQGHNINLMKITIW